MAAALPIAVAPSHFTDGRPLMGPPTMALPPLPPNRPRKSLALASRDPSPTAPSSAFSPTSTMSATARASSGSHLPSPAARAGSSVGATLASAKSISPAPSRLVTTANTSSHGNGHSAAGDNRASHGRRAVSATASVFPPHQTARVSNLPTSPYSASSIYAPAGRNLASSIPRRGSADAVMPTAGSRARRSKGAVGSNANFAPGVGASSLLNGGGAIKSVPGGPGTRGSDGLSSSHSPPLSRCSSRQGSDTSSATTFEDSGDGAPKGTAGADATADASSAAQGKEAKGNVIVSVRVRPDVGENGPVEGEWLVDGRRSLVAYRGREGGNYFYGGSCHATIASPADAAMIRQRLCSPGQERQGL